MQTILIMEAMSKTRKSLATTKGKDTSNRAKPIVAKAGVTKNRKRRYGCDGGLKK